MRAKNNATNPYRCLGQTRACGNSRFDVFFDRLELPDGKILPDFLTVRPLIQDAQGHAGALVLPEINQQIGLMSGYRHQFATEFWQAPGGFMEPGETVRATAMRELQEETGLSCPEDCLVSLGSICPDPGLIDAKVAIFLARCAPPSNIESTDREIGVGHLQFFSTEALKQIGRAHV